MTRQQQHTIYTCIGQQEIDGQEKRKQWKMIEETMRQEVTGDIMSKVMTYTQDEKYFRPNDYSINEQTVIVFQMQVTRKRIIHVESLF